MKIAAKKTAQGYLLSDERCDKCEMPLLLMNGSLPCKVCPAIKKWVQRKSKVSTPKQADDALGMLETAVDDACGKLANADRSNGTQVMNSNENACEYNDAATPPEDGKEFIKEKITNDISRDCTYHQQKSAKAEELCEDSSPCSILTTNPEYFEVCDLLNFAFISIVLSKMLI